MDDVLRQRLLRHIEALPEERMYQALDFIEFLSSKYAREPVRAPASGFQQFGERLQDRLRAQGVGLRAMRGTLDAMGTADRMVAGLTEAGKTLLREVEGGGRAPRRPEVAPEVRILPPRNDPGPPETRSSEP